MSINVKTKIKRKVGYNIKKIKSDIVKTQSKIGEIKMLLFFLEVLKILDIKDFL